MKSTSALNQNRGFFSFAIAIGILAVSGSLAILAARHHPPAEASAPAAETQVQSNAGGATVAPATEITPAQRSETAAGSDILLP
jgi:hypothetical protein